MTTLPAGPFSAARAVRFFSMRSCRTSGRRTGPRGANERTWQRGDVIELFLQKKGCARLLRIPRDARKPAAPGPFSRRGGGHGHDQKRTDDGIIARGGGIFSKVRPGSIRPKKAGKRPCGSTWPRCSVRSRFASAFSSAGTIISREESGPFSPHRPGSTIAGFIPWRNGWSWKCLVINEINFSKKEIDKRAPICILAALRRSNLQIQLLSHHL